MGAHPLGGTTRRGQARPPVWRQAPSRTFLLTSWADIIAEQRHYFFCASAKKNGQRSRPPYALETLKNRRFPT